MSLSFLVASAKWAITAASIRSVLARLPSAWAKARTCAGLTTTTGRPAPARPAATTASKPPVAKTALYTLARDARIPARKIGKKWVFEKAGVDAWVRANQPLESFFLNLDF